MRPAAIWFSWLAVTFACADEGSMTPGGTTAADATTNDTGRVTTSGPGVDETGIDDTGPADATTMPEDGTSTTTAGLDSAPTEGTDHDGSSTGGSTDATSMDPGSTTSTGSTDGGSTDTGASGDDSPLGVLDFETSHWHLSAVFSTAGRFVLADFNGDGALDFAAPDTFDDTINILLNDGSGQLALAIENDVPQAGRTAAGDVDADGFVDVVTIESNNVHTLFGLGDGTLSAAVTTVHSVTYAPWLGDIDGDGHVDLIARESGAVRILPGDGTGAFSLLASYLLGNTQTLAVVDIDADGFQDLVAHTNSNVFVRRGDGTGAFGPQTLHPITSMGVISIGIVASIDGIGDLNGDGYSEVAAADNNGVTILLGDPAGGLTQHVRFAGCSPVFGDFDDDGLTDLLLETCNQAGRSLLRYGIGDGTFGAAVEYTTGVGASGSGHGVAADMDLDGAVDVVHAGLTSIQFGIGDGTLRIPRVSPTIGPVQALAAGDFNGDAYPDIVVTLEYASSVATMLAQADRRFAIGPQVVLPQVAETVAVGDLNEDGMDDVVWGRPAGQGGVLLGDGTGGLQGTGQPLSGGDPLAIVDIDGDGHQDVVAAWSVQLRVSLGDGTGDLAPALVSACDDGVQSFTIFDADADGDLDLATASWTGSISLLLAQGDGTFAPGYTFAIPGSSMVVAHGDFNEDGIEDLAYQQYVPLGIGISIALGLGDGTFGIPDVVGLPVANVAGYLLVEDFDGDGDPDIAYTGSGSFMDLLVSAGDGSFTQGRRQPLAQAKRFVASDQDLDGKPDIVAVHNAASSYGFVSTVRNASQ